MFRSSTALSVVIGVWFSLTPAAGQWVLGLESPWTSAIDAEEIERIREAVHLDEPQYDTVQTLFRDHHALVAALVGGTQRDDARLEQELSGTEIGSRRAFEIAVSREQQAADCASRLQELDAEFLNDVAILLHPQQEPLWAEHIRQRRWDQAKRISSTIPGVQVNLSAIAYDVLATDQFTDELRTTLNDYESTIEAMHAAMITATIAFERDRWKRTRDALQLNTKARKAIDSGHDPASVGRQVAKRWRLDHRSTLATQVAVSRVNAQFTELIAAQVAPELQEAFRHRVRQDTHPLAYPNTSLLHIVVARLTTEANLSSEQYAAMQRILSDLLKAMDEINRKAAAAEAQWFEGMWRDYLSDSVERQGLTTVHEGFQRQRDRLSLTRLPDVRKILTPDQREFLDRMPWPPGLSSDAAAATLPDGAIPRIDR